MRLQSSLLLALGLFNELAYSHPGHDLTEEIAERRSFLQNTLERSLDHCKEKLARSGIEARNAARRAAHVDEARKKRGIYRAIEKRAIEDVLDESHNNTLGYTPVTDPELLFKGINSCILTPEVTQGPYCTCQPPIIPPAVTIG